MPPPIHRLRRHRTHSREHSPRCRRAGSRAQGRQQPPRQRRPRPPPWQARLPGLGRPHRPAGLRNRAGGLWRALGIVHPIRKPRGLLPPQPPRRRGLERCRHQRRRRRRPGASAFNAMCGRHGWIIRPGPGGSPGRRRTRKIARRNGEPETERGSGAGPSPGGGGIGPGAERVSAFNGFGNILFLSLTFKI